MESSARLYLRSSVFAPRQINWSCRTLKRCPAYLRTCRPTRRILRSKQHSLDASEREPARSSPLVAAPFWTLRRQSPTSITSVKEVICQLSLFRLRYPAPSFHTTSVLRRRLERGRSRGGALSEQPYRGSFCWIPICF